MRELPFEQPGRFWRGNLHTHSNQSDGALPPEQVARLYQEAGYDFVAITDHFRPEYGFPLTDTRALRTGEFTTILGAELHAPRTQFSAEWHIAQGRPLLLQHRTGDPRDQPARRQGHRPVLSREQGADNRMRPGSAGP